MPITLDVRENERILFIVFTNPWTLTDLLQNFERDQAFRDRANQTIHALVDCTQMHSLPPGVISIGRRSPSFNHRTKGYIVAFGATGTIQAIGNLVARMLRMDKLKFVSTEDEAMSFLRHIISQENANASN